MGGFDPRNPPRAYATDVAQYFYRAQISILKNLLLSNPDEAA